MLYLYESVPPWLLPDVFPEAPEGYPYGYLRRGKLVACNPEELFRECTRNGLSAVHLVWTPDSPRLVTVNEVGFLFEALRRRARSFIWMNLGAGVAGCLVFGALYLYFRFVAQEAAQPAWFFILFLALGAIPTVQSVAALRQMRFFTPYGVEAASGTARFFAWVGLRPRPFTWFVAAVVLVIGLVQFAAGFEQSYGSAGLIRNAVESGEWWRVMTGPLLHGGFIHLFFNLVAVLVLGRFSEALANAAVASLVLVGSAIGGAVCSLIFLPANISGSVGLSGGLMGQLGFLLILGLKKRPVIPFRLTKAMGLSVLLIGMLGAFYSGMIDNAGHFGGLGTGMILAWLLVRRSSPLPLPQAVLSRGLGIMMAAMMAVFSGYAIWKILGS